MPLRLDLRHYETVVAIVELGTMTEAAKHLATTQSALSHRLAQAEARLGVRLFDRDARRRLEPTRAGLVVHQTASRALTDLERSESLLLADDARITSRVRIGVGSYDCFHWWPEFEAIARARHPEIDLELVVVGDNPGAALAARDADLVVAPGRPEGVVTRTWLFDDELVCVVAPGHRLAERPWIDADDLAAETYLTYNPAPTPGFEFDRFIRPADDYPRIVTVVPNTSTICELVAAGSGVSILSRWALTPAVEHGRIVAVRCGRDGLDLAWSALVRADDPPAAPPERVAAVLAEVFGARPR